MAKKPTMAQAYKAAAKKSGDKGIVGEGKDVLKATGNSVKQQAEFVAAVGKGAAKGAGAIAKGAGKVAGKVANITVGDIASAPLDIAKNAAKGAAKVGKVLATPAGGSMLRAAMPKGSGVRAAGIMGAKVAAKVADSKANKARQATDSKYDKVSATPKPNKRKPIDPSAYESQRKRKGPKKQMDPGMYKPKGTPRPKQMDPGMYKPRGKNPGQSGGRPSQRGL